MDHHAHPCLPLCSACLPPPLSSFMSYDMSGQEDVIWKVVRKEAKEAVRKEPDMTSYFTDMILRHSSAGECPCNLEEI